MVHPPMGTIDDRGLLHRMGRTGGLAWAHWSKNSADAMCYPTEKEAGVAASFLTLYGILNTVRVERL